MHRDPLLPRQTQKTIGPQSRNLYMLYIYTVSDSVTLHWINCHLNICLDNKEKMGRAKNTIKTYGRHRQRVITADIWSSDDEKKTDTAGGLFSSSSSSLDSSAQNSTNDSLFEGPITTRRFWQQSKNLIEFYSSTSSLHDYLLCFYLIKYQCILDWYQTVYFWLIRGRGSDPPPSPLENYPFAPLPHQAWWKIFWFHTC